MNDDWCPPTDEHDVPGNLDAVPSVATPDQVDPVLGISEGDVRVVDAFYHELALDASKDPSPLTAEEEAAELRMVASFERLKSMTREELLALREHRLRERRRLDDK